MEASMPRTSKGKRKSEVVPAVGIVGLSLSMAGGASAAAALPVGDLSAQEVALRPEVSAGLQLHEEEIAAVSLATFDLFDKEEASTTRDGNVQLAGWRGCRCGGWRGCRGCWGWRGGRGGGGCRGGRGGRGGGWAAGAGAAAGAAGAAGVVAADADADRADLLTATTI